MTRTTHTTDPAAGPGLKRELKARHLTMIAIGGSIGTGLFVASGATISQAGPGGALLAYAVIGLMVYFLMTSLGELAAYMPV
jgi:lysine-specific permease